MGEDVRFPAHPSVRCRRVKGQIQPLRELELAAEPEFSSCITALTVVCSPLAGSEKPQVREARGLARGCPCASTLDAVCHHLCKLHSNNSDCTYDGGVEAICA